MSGDAKTCSRPGCTKRLRSDNTKGVCANRKLCGGAAAPAPAPEPAALKPVASSSSDVLRRFRLLAEALGLDPDAVLQDFAQTWLDRALRAVRLATNPPPRAADEEEEDTRMMGALRQQAEMRIGRP